MRKFSVIAENGYADLVPDDNGDVVPASVAQALYDALVLFMEEADFKFRVQGSYGNMKHAKAAGDKAPSLADGEE